MKIDVLVMCDSVGGGGDVNSVPLITHPPTSTHWKTDQGEEKKKMFKI